MIRFAELKIEYEATVIAMANIVSPPETGSPETVVEMGRLSGLSDGVYAIVLTLVVFDIRIPEDAFAGGLSITLLELAPKLLIYLINLSFGKGSA